MSWWLGNNHFYGTQLWEIDISEQDARQYRALAVEHHRLELGVVVSRAPFRRGSETPSGTGYFFMIGIIINKLGIGVIGFAQAQHLYLTCRHGIPMLSIDRDR